MNLDKAIQSLEEYIKFLWQVPSMLVRHYDHLHGYPYGRIQLIASLALGFIFWYATLSLVIKGF